MADLQDDPHTSPPSDTASVGELDPVQRTDMPEPTQSVQDQERAPERPVESDVDVLGRARALLADHPVADGYNGLGWTLRRRPWHDLQLGESTLDTDIPRLRTGGVGAQFWSLHVPVEYTGDRAVSATLEQIDLVRSFVAGYPEGLRLALGPGDMTDARNCGRIASFLGPVSGHALGDSLGTLRAYHALGVRSLGFAGTDWAGGAGDGLTVFGQEVVREMNRLGVLIDLAGTSSDTVHSVLSISRAPVLFSRSAARALADHPANVPDDVLRALGPDRGVCLVSFAPEQIGAAPSVRKVADHLDHVREVAGAQCVGLSGMYGAGLPHADELTDASSYPRVVAELLDRGWDETDIALLTWGNVARAVRDAEFTARAARHRPNAS
ncbi:dipeptidase [Streptomyces spiramyceticus]|uniref:dipeptidase n=1 Tax=Streptomyces spiramyceticus TaxID=299717 RepID=UPI00237A7467|nr:dipeptidase [Streptomyces spiramyceticus]